MRPETDPLHGRVAVDDWELALSHTRGAAEGASIVTALDSGS